MSKIIGISGPQGSGKTTLLNDLKSHGLYVDDYKVSRATQEQFGWASLDQVMTSFDTMVKFQSKVISNKVKNDTNLILTQTAPFIFVERTAADIFAYTKLWADKFVAHGEVSEEDAGHFLTEFHGRCRLHLNINSRIIMLPYSEHMVFEADVHRASEEDIEPFTNNLTEFLNYSERTKSKVATLTAKSVRGRSDEVLSILKDL